MTDETIIRDSVSLARSKCKEIAKELTSLETYPSERSPISIFMAGSPGAGKTELSKNLIAIFESQRAGHIIRIDGDELRDYFPAYNGRNAHLFQNPISILIDEIIKTAYRNHQSILLDGTLANYERAVTNIHKALDLKRIIFILYVYQPPEIAWKFTVAREQVEGRKISKTTFINGFLGAKNSVEKLRQKFNEEITILLIIKDYVQNKVETIVELKAGSLSIDDYLPKTYSKEELERIL